MSQIYRYQKVDFISNFKITHINLEGFTSFNVLIYYWLIFNTVNIILPILFSIKINNGKTKRFYPNIIKLIK